MSTIRLTTSEAAALEGVTERRITARIAAGELAAERAPLGRNGRGWLVELASLSPAAQARYYVEHPEATLPLARDPHDDSPAGDALGDGRKSTLSYTGAPQSIRQRADLRLEAVLSWRRTLAGARRDGAHVGEAERGWLVRMRRSHHGFKVSIASVKRWDRAYRAAGIDGLVDGNDGRGRRGKRSLHPELEADFRALWLQPTRPKVQACYRDLAKIAAVRGLPLPSYSVVRRLASEIPDMVVAACRYEEESSIRPFVPRDYFSLRGLDLIQSDHHQSDVAAHCGDPLCDRGHYPWITGWIDIRSRKILTFDVLIDCPNSRSILRTMKRTILDFGVPNGASIDNGLDYKKAMGWTARHREWGRERAKSIAVDFAGPQVEHRLAPLGMRVTFALPYNPQAKLIERFFRTLVDQAWRMFPSYRGALGQRSEQAEHLRKHPELLPTLSDLTLALQRKVDEYNDAPHSGHGMNGRSPNAVFEETRIPRVDSDPVTLSLVFHDSKSCKVFKNGLRFNKTVYRLDDVAAHAAWFGKQVRVRFDPEDLTELVVTSAEGKFISLAHERELATYSTRDQKTRDLIELSSRDWKAMKKLIRAENPAAAKRLEKIAGTLEEYHALRAREMAAMDAMPVAASGGGSVVQVLPYESTLARAIDDARARVANPTGLSAADLELARSVDAPSDQDLADFASHHSFAGLISPRGRSGRPEADDDVSTESVLEDLGARREQRRMAECEAEGMCTFVECPEEAVEKGLCNTHFNQLFGG